jgi:hypothetical protein
MLNKSLFLLAVIFWSSVPFSHLINYYFIDGIQIFDSNIEGLVWFIFFIFAIGLMLTYNRTRSFLRYVIDARSIFFSLFIIWSFVSTFYSDYKIEGIKSTLELAFPFSIYIVSMQYINGDIHKIKLLRKYLWISLVLGLIFTVSMPAIGRPLFMTDYLGTYRFVGSMGWATYSYFILPFFAMSLSGYYYGNKNYILITIFLASIIFLTLSRTAILAVIISSIITFYLWKPRNKIVYYLPGLIIVIITIFILTPPIVERTIVQSGDADTVRVLTSGRSRAVNYLISEYINDPLSLIIGVGRGTSKSTIGELSNYSIRSVHSQIITSFIDSGIVGLMFYTFFIAINFFVIFRQIKRINDRLVLRSLFEGLIIIISLFTLYSLDNASIVFTISVMFVILSFSHSLIKLKLSASN